MTERPILFNTEMVRAILEGRKTQTRRLIRPQYRGPETGFFINYRVVDDAFSGIDYHDGDGRRTRSMRWPCYPGDVLWVRETWNYGYVDSNYREYSEPDTWFEQEDPKEKRTHYMACSRYWYYADAEDSRDMKELAGRWRPSIHMPREAARLFLRVKDVRSERIQSITNKDAKAEGVTCATDNSGMMHRHKFRQLWDSITGPGNNWEANPWVWVIEFERIENYQPRKEAEEP